MTVVEFFTDTPIENIISSITVAFNKIIFVGDNKLMAEFKPIYEKFAQKRELKAEICYRGINKNNLPDIVEVLSEIVEQEDECFFDLTGGEDLVLVAMGIVFERYKHKKIRLEHFNFNSLKASDADADGVLLSVDNPKISIEEIIGIHGGTIVCTEDSEEDIGTFKWCYTEDFVKDVDAMWEICRRNPKKWNSEINVISKMCEFLHNNKKLDVSSSFEVLAEYVNSQSGKYLPINDLLRELQSNGIIKNLSIQGGQVSFSFKNAQIKKCLTKAGTVLELKVTTTAMAATRKDKSLIYDEVLNGVYIDWNGGETNELDTFNEIDVILLSGFTPIFVSCKNGQVDDDELYKLETVANRFGGEKVKTVLIASYFGKQGESREHFINRAKEMDIEFIEQVQKLDYAAFRGVVKQLVNS